MATMKDVARLAGVSTSTVSHVINKNRFVSDGVREKIEQAIRELNYA
ncbi:LacI family DNA-binding transcriptional regulator, partial [Pantoea ananatis]